MNQKASAIIAQEFIKGTFDVFDAMLSASFSQSVDDIGDMEPAAVADLLAAYPVAWHATLPSGGAVALLFTQADMAQLVASVEGTEVPPDQALNPQQMASLREIADPALGSGVTSVLAKCAHDPEQPQNVKVTMGDGEPPVDWASLLGQSFTAASFTFSAPPQFEAGTGYLLFSEPIESLAAGLVKESGQKEGGSLLLSEDEMNDILKTLDPDGTTSSASPSANSSGHGSGSSFGERGHGSASHHHSNMDMVLDIRLVVTARLGRVEMPLGDILALGPGSIIDVGRLVDEPVELLVNSKLIAKGDVVVVDEKFGLRITEIVGPKERIESMH